MYIKIKSNANAPDDKHDDAEEEGDVDAAPLVRHLRLHEVVDDGAQAGAGEVDPEGEGQLLALGCYVGLGGGVGWVEWLDGWSVVCVYV